MLQLRLYIIVVTPIPISYKKKQILRLSSSHINYIGWKRVFLLIYTFWDLSLYHGHMYIRNASKISDCICLIWLNLTCICMAVIWTWIWNPEKRNFRSVFHEAICSREKRKKQYDWLAINTDGITSQSHSLFACSCETNRQVENGYFIVLYHAIDHKKRCENSSLSDKPGNI